ncbi:DUF2510 domain-containing protein [Ilumatobacter sp.]|uniref:DUF2510 domain-containing protein n=1 Tax=Ilumatobacter sp. TaxID=1967498 RepID=UPI0037505C0C
MPSGWFPDSEQAGRLRFFDGVDWTDQYAATLSTEPAAAVSVEPAAAADPVLDDVPAAPVVGGPSTEGRSRRQRGNLLPC